MSQEESSSTKTKYTGKCKRFNPEKGFGFISVDDNSGDVFVHQTEIKADGYRTIHEGEELEFEIVTQDDGRRKAINVTGPKGAFVRGGFSSKRNRGGYGGGGYRGRGGGGYRGRGGGYRGGYRGGGYRGGGYNNNNNNYNRGYNNNNFNNNRGGGGFGGAPFNNNNNNNNNNNANNNNNNNNQGGF
eukprot:CAMPEP_0201593084 /NCGR_PEP_ID=MMETSP0190_2-20130828/190801_1 /ASSEMBLY_ACC=CAM_ASM_000263 /TAXON_ID=37353 /ORGANISM="Rosalina sp." /LENGTH=185 /DNA_ID=CAMNT_0048052151 /DNA_START=112 /DNA_END=669 /DNA_ORIENTATION=+